MLHRLEQNGNSYTVNRRVQFINNAPLSQADVEASFNFAYNMTFGAIGEHRNHRSGGQVRRHNGEIFIDTFQGKLAEFSFYNYFNSAGVDISEPDMSMMGLTEWDGCDFYLNEKQIAVKSTKYFGNLLLLETKDWDRDGLYKPNYGTDHAEYDFFVLIRIKPDGTSIMKSNRWLYSDIIREENLRTAMLKENWECNIAGYVSHEELVDVIRQRYILPQNAYLNGKTRMDAENYYVQLGDMHEISNLLREVF